MLSRSSANLPLLATGSPAQRPARPWPARRRRLWRRLPPLLALLLGWEALYHSAWLPAFVLPAPTAVARRTVEVVGDGSLWPHLQATLSAALAGYLLTERGDKAVWSGL